MAMKFVVAFVGLLAAQGVLATIGTVPKTPTVQRSQSAGSYSGAVTGFGSQPAGTPARQGSATSMANPETIENAVVMYNAMVAVIRDVVTKAKLTPIGGTEGVAYIQSCAEHKAKLSKGPVDTKTGNYVIWPTGKVLDGSKQIICDMATDGGGWTVIQRRGYGTVTRDKAENFNRNWREYKTGFGTYLGDYWIGLDTMHIMGTRCSNELMVTLTYFDDTTKTATYNNFTIGPEADNYRLHVAGFHAGAGGDVFEKKHDGLIFNTHDKDNEDKCGAETKSGWWFVSKKSKSWCAYVDLNAELKDKATDTGGMTWRFNSLLKGWQAPAIKKAEMKIRPKCPPA